MIEYHQMKFFKAVLKDKFKTTCLGCFIFHKFEIPAPFFLLAGKQKGMEFKIRGRQSILYMCT